MTSRRNDIPRLDIWPPIFNSSCPWSTTSGQLRSLLECPAVGAITTRTSLLHGFNHDPDTHRFSFFDPRTSRNQDPKTYSFPDNPDIGRGTYDESNLGGPRPQEWSATINTLGYSPLPLQEYVDMLKQLGGQVSQEARRKTAIISVTGPVDEAMECYHTILAEQELIAFPLAMEINLSCPNIEGSSPLAYDGVQLTKFLRALPLYPKIPVGIKLPPYTYKEQFAMLRTALVEAEAGNRLAFITTTNTLGTCMLTDDGDDSGVWTLPGQDEGLGGMAGPPLHPLALGNVRKISDFCGNTDGLTFIEVIGVGGVQDAKGFFRMRSAGANFVALASALGRVDGPSIFIDIGRDVNWDWNDFDEPRFSRRITQGGGSNLDRTWERKTKSSLR